MSIETNYAINRKKLVIRSVKEFAFVDTFNMQIKLEYKKLGTQRKRLIKEMEGWGYTIWYKRT